MGAKTTIEWTDSSWQLTRGCARVSPGCQHCYAESIARRFSGPGQPFAGHIHRNGSWNGVVSILPENLLIPWHWVKGGRIFVDSMSDLFHEQVPFEFIAAAFWVMSVTTRHTYQVLTKRPERMLEFFEWLKDHSGWGGDYCSDCADLYPLTKAITGDTWRPATKTRGGYDNCGPGWPFENIWLGVSVENQEAANERIPLLLRCPAAVRWISAEPLLGPIDLERIFVPLGNAGSYKTFSALQAVDSLDRGTPQPALDWVVAGGESGPGARPMHPDWARSLRDQCAAAGVPYFFKQWGAWAPATVEPGGDLGGDLRRGTVQHLHGPGNPEGHFRRGDAYVRLVGKKAAGRLLDGVEHNRSPEACHA